MCYTTRFGISKGLCHQAHAIEFRMNEEASQIPWKMYPICISYSYTKSSSMLEPAYNHIAMQDYPSIIPEVSKKDEEVLVLTDYYVNTNSNYFHIETITSSGSEWIHTTRELLLCTTASIPLSSHVRICSNIHMLGKQRKVQIWKWSAKLQSQGPASPTGQNKEKLLNKH